MARGGGGTALPGTRRSRALRVLSTRDDPEEELASPSLRAASVRDALRGVVPPEERHRPFPPYPLADGHGHGHGRGRPRAEAII
jgi:hypothetical protein